MGYRRIYHTGDTTVVYDGLIETLSAWDIDVAFVPISGRDAEPREALLGTPTSARPPSSPRRWTSV